MEALTSYREILGRIDQSLKHAGRTDSVELIAVSKTKPLEKVLELYGFGHRVFGENYVQELVEKSEELHTKNILDLQFHFIGKLQSNKVKALLPHVSVIHSVDSPGLISEISKRATALNRRIPIYLQVNIDEEETKSGFSVEGLLAIRESLSTYSGVEVLGLMAIPHPEKNVRSAFEKMKDLSKQGQGAWGTKLSMGMSHDFEAAIDLGSTSIRIGSALFGARR